MRIQVVVVLRIRGDPLLVVQDFEKRTRQYRKLDLVEAAVGAQVGEWGRRL